MSSDIAFHRCSRFLQLTSDAPRRMLRTMGCILLLSVAVPGCRPGALPASRMTVAGHSITVEIADSPDERSMGLMNRRSLPEDRGMLFVFETETQVSFWMKDTRIPLSIAFISADGTIRQIENMDPLSLDPVPSRRHVLYALEMNRGWFERKGVAVGDRVELPSDLP